MAPNIFITGGTGYIGGSVLDTVVKTHAEYNVTALLRTLPEKFSQVYPDVRVVRGDYDSAELLADEAEKAEVVIHCGSSDHEVALNALIAGLLRRKGEPGFLIHLSGTGIVADWNDDTYLGKLNPKVWSDIDDLDAIASLPNWAAHRNTEKVLNVTVAEHGDKVNIAIVCPPDIHGPGRGPGRNQSVLLSMFVKEARRLGQTFYVGEGANTRSWVHIDDLMQVYLKLVEAAASGGQGADWGKKGYYFTSTQEASQKQIAEQTGKVLHAHGLLASSEPRQLALEQLDGMTTHPAFAKLAVYLFAANSRTRAHRAEKLFGYKVSAPSLWETLEADLLASIEK